jgi:hypothetical protein
MRLDSPLDLTHEHVDGEEDATDERVVERHLLEDADGLVTPQLGQKLFLNLPAEKFRPDTPISCWCWQPPSCSGSSMVPLAWWEGYSTNPTLMLVQLLCFFVDTTSATMPTRLLRCVHANAPATNESGVCPDPKRQPRRS